MLGRRERPQSHDGIQPNDDSVWSPADVPRLWKAGVKKDLVNFVKTTEIFMSLVGGEWREK